MSTKTLKIYDTPTELCWVQLCESVDAFMRVARCSRNDRRLRRVARHIRRKLPECGMEAVLGEVLLVSQIATKDYVETVWEVMDGVQRLVNMSRSQLPEVTELDSVITTTKDVLEAMIRGHELYLVNTPVGRYVSKDSQL